MNKKDSYEFLFLGPLFSLFKSFNDVRRSIMSLQDTVDGIATRLGAVSTQLTKGFDEVRAKIAELQAEVAGGGTADFTAVNAALDAVAGQAQALDDVVPDAVSEEPPAEEPPAEEVPQ